MGPASSANNKPGSYPNPVYLIVCELMDQKINGDQLTLGAANKQVMRICTVTMLAATGRAS